MNLLLLAIAAAPAATSSLAGPSAARFNPAAPENRQLLASFSYASVEPVLTQIGARFQRAGTAPNRPVLLVTLPNNRKAILVFGSCDAAGSACKALAIQSFWTRIANSPPAAVTTGIERFNGRYSFSKAFVAADGRPSLLRYLTADYGFVRGNLAVNLLVFGSQADIFAREVLAPLERSPAQSSP